MHRNRRSARAHFLCGAAMFAVISMAGAARAADAGDISIPAQSLDTALNSFGVQTGLPVMFKPELAAGKRSTGVAGAPDAELALNALLEGTGLTWRKQGDLFLIEKATADPQSGSAAGDGADTVEALIVTAQKREENIQDVPIAISAFSAKALEEQKIEGGFDLLKAIPNVTFSKNNFSGYNFSIRGVGTKAISVTTDPGVAVEFNSTALIRNRLFEQEYFDVERVEVLRGPQGTLHGRNATAGVINVISAKPDLNDFEGWVKGEVGNYHSKRLSAMANVPLIEDKLALRLAGALTSRDGYDFNATTKNPVNGRDLWSARLTLGFAPTERLRGDLIWERFEEDDDRSRTGKQLCHRDAGLTLIGSHALQESFGQALTSQGCKPGSLYDPAAFGTPNGLSIPFVFLAGFSGTPGGQIGWDEPWQPGFDPFGPHSVTALKRVDPYGGLMQSPDLRVINSFKDPVYRAQADVVELNMELDLTSALTLASQTAYDKDTVYSFQDYNRFNTVPVFADTSSLWDGGFAFGAGNYTGPSRFRRLSPGGIYCDPQLGCSNTLAGFDISQAKSRQFSQELRLTSDVEGPLNFSMGANYTDYKTVEDYYVMYNILTLLSQLPGGDAMLIFNNSADISKCGTINVPGGAVPVVPAVDMGSPEAQGCIYIDPNPVESINGEGHNYFRSKNPYKLKSSAVFGEMYWSATDQVRVTAGLRLTDDRKTFTPVPTQVLLSSRNMLGGAVDRGYPEEPDIKQRWRELTGKLGVDWRPDLSWTDETLVYGSYSRGYKGGGANPPGIGFKKGKWCFPPFGICIPQFVQPQSYPAVFRPEFVNAYEVGAKNTLLGGTLILNTGAFYYNYEDYQVSQIKDRTAVNENFDAEVWGLEVETVFHASRDLRFNATLGYQDSRIGEGAGSIDLMDRTAGNPDYVLLKPFVTQPSNCVFPKASAERALDLSAAQGQQNVDSVLIFLCPGGFFGDVFSQLAVGDLFTGTGRTREEYLAETNGGAGFEKDLEGNELPNAPHWTVSLGAQYGWDFAQGWRATIRGDTYWQSQSWARVYNDDPYDKLHGWYNANLSVWIERPDDGLKIELYAKNILNDTPITDAFLNSDDTALTTNVFVLDPRVIGLSIRKEF